MTYCLQNLVPDPITQQICIFKIEAHVHLGVHYSISTQTKLMSLLRMAESEMKQNNERTFIDILTLGTSIKPK